MRASAGQGFDVDSASAPEGSPLEAGRGPTLMEALVDDLQFVRSEDGPHRVELEKRLRTEPTLRLLQT